MTYHKECEKCGMDRDCQFRNNGDVELCDIVRDAEPGKAITASKEAKSVNGGSQ